MKKTLFSLLGLMAFISSYSQISNADMSYANNYVTASAINTSILDNKYLRSEDGSVAVSKAIKHDLVKGKEIIKKKDKRTTPTEKNNRLAIENFGENTNTAITKISGAVDSAVIRANNCCVVTYTLANEGKFKYKLHIEGKVKDCEDNHPLGHAYISVNSALNSNKFDIIPTGADGQFTTDVTDDSIMGITIFKKGYSEKEVNLATAASIQENTSYAFNVCLEKTKSDDGSNSVTTVQSTKVFFGFNKTNLNSDAKEFLDSVIKKLKKIPAKSTLIEINGHTDSKGSKAYNLKLSKARSLVCKRYIQAHGINNVRMKINAFGSSLPIEVENLANNGGDNPIGRFKNRRVEIVIKKLKNPYKEMG